MLTPLVVDTLMASTLGQVLLGLVALSVVVLVGRLVLNVAWKLVMIATVIVGLVYVATIALPALGMGVPVVVPVLG